MSELNRSVSPHLEAILDVVGSMIIATDLDGTIRLFNAAAERLLGWRAAEVIGQQTPVLWHDPAEVALRAAELSRELGRSVSPGFEVFVTKATVGETEEREWTCIRMDGSRFPVRLSVSPLRDGTGRITGYVGITQDLTDRMRVEEERDSFFDLSRDLLCVANTDGYFKRINPAFKQTLGWTYEEILSRPFLDLVHPDDRAATVREVEKLTVGQPTLNFQNRYLCKDGSYRWLTWTCTPQPNGTLYAAGRDVTELKQAEKALRDRQDLFETIIEAAPNAMVMIDGERRITFVNYQMEKLFGYARAELLGQPIELLVPARYRPEHPAYVGEFFAAPQPRAMGAGRDLFGLRKDGSEVPVEIGLNPISIDKSMFVLASVVDITQRKRQAELMRLVVEAAPNAMVMIDGERRITLVNHQMEKLFGYARAELLGQPIELLVPARYRPEHPAHVGEFFAAPQPRAMGAGRDLFGLRKDGSEVPVEIGLNPISIDEGMFVLASIIDITQRKRHEEQLDQFNRNLNQRAEQLLEANKELESFSYSISHDLRAPLRHIQGYIDMLAKDAGNQITEKSQRYLKIVFGCAVEMGQLIDNLLEFSRMGRASLGQGIVSLDALVRDIVTRLTAQADDRSIVWKVADLPDVIGDAAMLKQVLVNLLENSVKYTRPRNPAEIEIGCMERQDEHVTLFVRDNGVGFDMQYAHKLFGVFQRLHRADEFEGTGIGLANVRRIIVRHGGRVWAESKLNEGTTFYFTLKPVSAE